MSVAKWIGGPGSIGFFVLCSALGLVMAGFGGRTRRMARAWLGSVLIVYLLASLPLVSSVCSESLPRYTPLWEGGPAMDDDILVVLSGDNALGRARETQRVLSAFAPRCVLVSGSPWFVRMIVDAGVARDRLQLDESASTTREQIAKLETWAKNCGVRRVVLIASQLSMPRISALIPQLRVPVVLVASPLDSSPATHGIRKIIPSFTALAVTRDAVYEHVALAYYRWRRWI